MCICVCERACMYVCVSMYVCVCEYVCTAGKISIEHVTIFLSNNISKGAIDVTFSPDDGNNPSNQYIHRNQHKYIQQLSYVYKCEITQAKTSAQRHGKPRKLLKSISN